MSCELFLNFIVFDEHTCKASASVCWDDTQVSKQVVAPGKTQTPAGGGARPASDPAKTKTVKKGTAIETGAAPRVSPVQPAKGQ